MDAEFTSELRQQFSPDETYLVGVSGGRDSMALWHLLREAGYQNLVICHLNHRLRGAESDRDERLVRQTAAERRTEVEIGSVDVRVIAQERKLSIENTARQARHEFFAELARKYSCSNIFMGHHADDHVETVLINLCRGTGLRGLGGMRIESEIVVGKTTLRLIRPLLKFWRVEIDEYIDANSIEFVEDATNAEVDESTRNRVRHELIPLMRELFDRDVRRAIRRVSSMAVSREAGLESLLELAWPQLSITTGEQESLRIEAMLELDETMQRAVIYRWLKKEPDLPACSFRDIDAVLGILSPEAKTAKVNLRGGWHVRRNRGRIFLQPPEKS